jgi:integrase
MKLEEDYPGLLPEKTPAGNPRWRVRVLGHKKKRITLGVPPGHPDFKDHYDAARRGKKLQVKAPTKAGRGTLDELREKYSAALLHMVANGQITEETMASRLRGLNQACNVKHKGRRMGALHVDLPKDGFVLILDSFGAKTGAAETCLKALKAAYLWGEDRGFPKNSLVHRVNSPHSGRGGAKVWSGADEAKFLARHGRGTMARRWFYLSKNTAGRIDDIVDIGPKNIKLKNGRAYLGWQPKKKGSKYVLVPVMQEFAEELELGDWHEEAFILTAKGRPFESKNSLGNRIAKWAVQADLTRDVEVKNTKTGEKTIEKRAARSQHGIRKAAAHELAQSGASVYEIAARLSHSDFKSSAPYVEDVDRAKLAESGFDRAEKARQAQGVPRHINRGTPEGAGSIKIRSLGKRWQPVGEYQKRWRSQ